MSRRNHPVYRHLSEPRHYPTQHVWCAEPRSGLRGCRASSASPLDCTKRVASVFCQRCVKNHFRDAWNPARNRVARHPTPCRAFDSPHKTLGPGGLRPIGGRPEFQVELAARLLRFHALHSDDRDAAACASGRRGLASPKTIATALPTHPPLFPKAGDRGSVTRQRMRAVDAGSGLERRREQAWSMHVHASHLS
jgi:hypothetical protein